MQFRNLTLTAQTDGIRKQINAVQSDTGRYLRIVVEDIDMSQAQSAQIYVKKPDGTEVYDECLFDGDVIIAPLKSAALQVTGLAEAELQIFDRNTEYITTYKFLIRIEKSLIEESAIPSSNEYGALQAALANIVAVEVSIEELDERINSLYEISITSGSVVDSMSDMEDQSKIYVLRTDGKAYYYNGTEWTVFIIPTDLEPVEIDSWADVRNIVRLGHGAKLFPVADQFEVERETSLTASKGDSTGITGVTVVPETFLEKVGESHQGVYEAHYDGSVWHTEDESSIVLSEYGITVTGTPVEGDVIVITETAQTLTFDVLDHDAHSPAIVETPHMMALGMHDLFNYSVLPYSAAQALYFAQEGLPAGNYKLTLDHGAYNGSTTEDATYMFTLTQDVPAGGALRHANMGMYQSSAAAYTVERVCTGKFITYGVQPARTQIEQVTCQVWDGTTQCTDLGTFTASDVTRFTNDGKHNYTQRQYYGSNRWRDSAERQFLNSNAKNNWWTPQNGFDMPPGGTAQPGFLHGLDKGFVDSLCKVKHKTALANCDRIDGATYDETEDLIWLQSMTEVFGQANNGIMEGQQLKYWLGKGDADRIKYEGATARYWWLRGPYPSHANHVRHVHTSGALDHNSAYSSYGVVPACCIG